MMEGGGDAEEREATGHLTMKPQDMDRQSHEGFTAVTGLLCCGGVEV